jgi:glycine cleavage system aminomethyltransferase T
MPMSDTLSRTPLFALHVELGGRIVPFAGWEMPVQYLGNWLNRSQSNFNIKWFKT